MDEKSAVSEPEQQSSESASTDKPSAEETPVAQATAEPGVDASSDVNAEPNADSPESNDTSAAAAAEATPTTDGTESASSSSESANATSEGAHAEAGAAPASAAEPSPQSATSEGDGASTASAGDAAAAEGSDGEAAPNTDGDASTADASTGTDADEKPSAGAPADASTGPDADAKPNTASDAGATDASTGPDADAKPSPSGDAQAKQGEGEGDGKKKRKRRRRKKKKKGAEGEASSDGGKEKKDQAFTRFFDGHPPRQHAFRTGEVIAGRVDRVEAGAIVVDLFGKATAIADVDEPREIPIEVTTETSAGATTSPEVAGATPSADVRAPAPAAAKTATLPSEPSTAPSDSGPSTASSEGTAASGAAPTQASTHEAPSTDAPSADAQSTDAQSTDAPSTDAQSTDAQSTDAPSTDAPSTDAPSTDAQPADAQSTDAQSTDAPSTDAPSTDAQSTDAPSTDAPSTDAQSTDAQSTDAPSTDAQSTDAQPTDALSTDASSNAKDVKDDAKAKPKKAPEPEYTPEQLAPTELEPLEPPAVGSIFRGRVAAVSESGHIAIVNRLIDRKLAKARVRHARDERNRLRGVVFGYNRGGFDVIVEGIRAFCPASGMALGMIDDPENFVGQRLEFTIPTGKTGRSIIVTRRGILEREARKAARERMKTLEKGQRLKGPVTEIRDYGVLVSLGDGLDGLVHQSEVSWSRGVRPADAVSVGQEVEVEILKVTPATRKDRHGRVALSIKACLPDPFDEHAEVLKRGVPRKGKVVRTTDFGAFVELVPGIEGLLHISELGRDLKHANEVLKEGEEIDILIERLDKKERRISLSRLTKSDLQAIESGEWDPTLAPKSLKRGAHIQVTVDRVEHHGIFVQVAGVLGKRGRGYLPNRELPEGRGDKKKRFAPGTTHEVKIIGTDRDGGLRLSIKGREIDEERKAVREYRKEASKQGFGTFGDLLKQKIAGSDDD